MKNRKPELSAQIERPEYPHKNKRGIWSFVYTTSQIQICKCKKEVSDIIGRSVLPIKGQNNGLKPFNKLIKYMRKKLVTVFSKRILSLT